ncbi:MAG: alpha/beta hydrolase [Polyangiales bacterium]
MDPLKRNNVKVFGDGATPMVFAHGYACDQNMWRHITPSFCDQYRIVTFDHVGMGGSDLTGYAPARYDTLQGYADDLLEVCAALELHDAIFVGHSVGAMIGVLAATRDPKRFSRMVLIGISPRYIDEGDYVGGFTRESLEAMLAALELDYQAVSTDTLAPLVMGNPDRPELTRELASAFTRTDSAIASRFARVTFLSDYRDALPRVRTPSLVVQCAYDAIAPLAVGQYVHEQMPNSRLVMMRATGHCPNLSAPTETIEVIKNFLARERK